VSADIIEFSATSARHGLSRADIADLRRRADLLPGAVIDPCNEGDRSRLWLRFHRPPTGQSPAFGFARRHDLIWLLVRRVGPGCPDGEAETTFSSIAAAMAGLLGAIRPELTNGPPL